MVPSKEGVIIIPILQVKSEGLRKQGQVEVYRALGSESYSSSTRCLSCKTCIFSRSSAPQKFNEQLGSCSFTLTTSNKTNGI